MFSVRDREQRQSDLISLAESDEEIIGAALVGSSATGKQDTLSDIDLALQIAPDSDITAVIDRWTELVKSVVPIAHTLDVVAGNGVLYRVFLASDSMQMDISFWPHDEFRASGDRFRLLFGTPNEPAIPHDENVDALIGMGWLFAIHVRSALAREQYWYAHSLMDSMRIRIMMLASIRHGLDPHQRREVDQLPEPYLIELRATLASSLERDALTAAFSGLMTVYLAEIAAHDPELFAKLSPTLSEIAIESARTTRDRKAST